VATAERLVRHAAGQGAQIILLQELFETPYFCQDQKQDFFGLAAPVEDHPVLRRMSTLAAELEVVLPVSFFERANNAYYNSLAMIDADGRALGVYRKSHIPDGPGYQEKYYFNPGDTGFRVFKTRYATIGAAICWDQWFPESARSMALQGAEALFYPTAIGSEPQDAGLDSRDHWQRVMQGHAGANLDPLIASNRIGREQGDSSAITFYGSSFIAGPQGEKVVEAGREEEAVLTATFDLDKLRAARASWGLFRDRRPELYSAILTLDGSQTLQR
jgi:N-carbamoylputrescine amidase